MSTSLSSEDLLRLNVLLAHNLQAVRIDEQTLTLHGLSDDNEARIPLNPNCRAEKYLKLVREMLSNHALGSPGGYPVFLQRWTRMGQAKDTQLEKLLLLGESEAVVAVAGAPGLTDDIARRAWWAMPTADIARRMLERETVAQGHMGKVLAAFLVEHLPFETDPLTTITTVRLVLQPGLISDDTCKRLWTRGTQRNAYHLGFLEAVSDDLPAPVPARVDYEIVRAALAPLTNNPLAVFLTKLLGGPGQTFLAVSETQLCHPLDKYTTARLFDTIGNYFAPARRGAMHGDIAAALTHAELLVTKADQDISMLLTAVPTLRQEIAAILALAHCAEAWATPVISKTSASGTLLKRKLEPVIEPLLARFAVLQGKQRNRQN